MSGGHGNGERLVVWIRVVVEGGDCRFELSFEFFSEGENAMDADTGNSLRITEAGTYHLLTSPQPPNRG